MEGGGSHNFFSSKLHDTEDKRRRPIMFSQVASIDDLTYRKKDLSRGTGRMKSLV
jgi:hypothetical protein